ncbi:MAG: RHS repeat-associated core domain-containing protein [Armatimonadetes bacterium]|nr:RHS repeat-associated core domain-containing protein [Armatimonadota bacterium]
MTVGTTTTDYILDSSNVIQEKVGTTVTARYMSGNRGPEYRRGISTPPEWYVFDGLGSVVATVSDNGVVQSTKQYDGYGAVRASSGGTPSKHKYVGNLGHTSEDETGLIYMRARYMDPVTGRFESEDPAKDGVNWYIYVRANPICNRDENGKESMGETMTATFEGQRLQANWRSVQFSATNQGIRKLIKSVARRIGYDELNDHQIHTLIHEIKSMGMGPADNIGIDRYGFAWTEGGECIGWIFDWLL